MDAIATAGGSTIDASTALSLSSVNASNGVTCTGGRGGLPSGGAQLRLVSSGGILAAAPALFFGVGGEDLQVWEYNYLGFSHFWRTSSANAWSESARVTSNNKWNFWSGIYTPSDARLKDDVQDLPSDECLDVLRHVSAKTYRRNELAEQTRRIGFLAQDAEAALGPNLANANIVGSIEREVQKGGTETLKTMSYERMSVILWHCTRSLLARVEALEAKLAQ